MTNSLVFQHLKRVAPNLSSEFKQKHECFSKKLTITLESVLQKYLVDSSVFHQMLIVTPNLANAFLRKNPFVCKNIVSIQKLLTQFKEHGNPRKRKLEGNPTAPLSKKIKPSELTENSVVYHHLLEVTPELASEFTLKHSVKFPIETSLTELVNQYLKDKKENESRKSKGIIKNSPLDSIQVIQDVIDVLSDSESTESSGKEDTDSDIIPVYEIRNIGSSSSEDDESCVVSSSSSNSSEDDSDIVPIHEKINRSSNIKDENNSDSKAGKDKINLAISKSKPNMSKVSNHLIDSSKNIENLTHNPKVDMLDENMNEYRHISESSTYSDLYKTLEKDSVVDEIVLHILNKNILISQLNFDHIVLCASQVLRHKHASIPANVDLGSFSPQDNKTITSNWEKLVTEVNISNPEETFKLFCKRPTKETKLKANVLGLYLSQGMEKLRLAADVFHHSERKILNFVRGNISPSDHDFIMDYISKHGQTRKAFNSCAKLLNRRYPDVIRQHYFKHFENLLKKGPYTLLENKFCISEVFKKSNIKTVLDIKNEYSKEGTVKKETFKEIAKNLGRPVQNIVCHWEHSLKPLLLQYHAGTVNFDVKRILANHLLEKNLVYMQDIPWTELLMNPQFAGHTKSSLGHIFNDLVRLTQRKHGCKREEVTIEQIAAYVDKLKPKFGKQVSSHKQELIDHYRSLIDVKNV